MLVPTLDYESFLHAVMATTGDLIISTDPQGAITTWSAAAEKATGYACRDVRGSRFADHIEEPHNKEVDAFFRKIAEDEDRRCVDWPMRLRSGESMPLSWRLSRMTDQAGEVAGVVAVGCNPVEQRVKETEMRQGEKLAALGMVIGGIAHEIRNPLGVSSAAAQLMRETMTAPALLEECIDKVIAGIDRASLVVESLLRFARPGPITQTTKVDVLDMLNNALALASGDAAAGTTVDWQPPCMPAPLYAEGVQNLLELVIVNLILNAFQAMPNGGRLTIAGRRDGAEAVIEIRDTGPGIPEAHLAKIFDPFFTTRSDSRRAGLGLSVSHAIVRQHGGNLTVRTSPSDGATFVVRIPGARDSSAAAGAADAC
ncbi:MAG: PAS domain S-box protein [Methylocystis sp.]|nr:PAS domain S-box protein [Methylocystis sp.]